MMKATNHICGTLVQASLPNAKSSFHQNGWKPWFHQETADEGRHGYLLLDHVHIQSYPHPRRHLPWLHFGIHHPTRYKGGAKEVWGVWVFCSSCKSIGEGGIQPIPTTPTKQLCLAAWQVRASKVCPWSWQHHTYGCHSITCLLLCLEAKLWYLQDKGE